MPIRPDLRQFYSGLGWRLARGRILKRAGGEFDGIGLLDSRDYQGGARCEQCRKPDRARIVTMTWKDEATGRPRMLWTLDQVITEWHDEFGRPHKGRRPIGVRVKIRTIYVQLGVAHLNHVAGDDRDENLKLWCNWCHLHYDAQHHKETRSGNKDAGRPLFGGGL